MTIDVLSVKGDILSAYPQLKKLPSWSAYASKPGAIDTQKLFRYIVLLYSHDSILNTYPQPPLEERQEQSALTVGFAKKNNKWPDQITGLFNLDDEHLVQMVFEFIISLRRPDWELVIATEIQRKRWIRNLMGTNENIKDAKLIREDAKKTAEEIENLYRKIFADHEKVSNYAEEVMWDDTIESII